MNRSSKVKIIIGIISVAVIIFSIIILNSINHTSSPEGSIQQDTPEDIRVISHNLNTPWSIAFYRDIPLISSRDTGAILEINEDGTPRIITTIDNVFHRGEGGLLGLAIHGSYLYTYYTTDTDNRISRFLLSGERGALSMGQEEVIMEGLPSATIHNGGRIAFGPDGMLYATVGDTGNGSNSQDLSTLSGKILRMTPTGEIPGDNPFPGSFIYSYGHRNPQGLAWSEDGTLYASEFGQNTWDELNVILPGANYGWPIVEGIEGNDNFEEPIAQWPVSEASPSGMTYFNGTLYLANLRGSVLRTVPLDDPTNSRDYFSGEYGRLRDVTIAPDGTLWLITNNTDGRGIPAEDDDRLLSIPVDILK